MSLTLAAPAPPAPDAPAAASSSCASTPCTRAGATETARTLQSTPQDFDFLIGHWQVSHRRLKERLLGCTDWEALEGRCRMWPLLGGLGNIDDNVLELPTGPYRALSMRTFDPATGQWAIWWVDGRHPHRLDPPVVGGFADGIGEFQCDDELRSQPVRVRYRWIDITPVSACWQQAFSADGGLSWETNWVMDFRRLAGA